MNKKLKNLAARLEEETGCPVMLEGTVFTIGIGDGMIKVDGAQLEGMPEDTALSALIHIVDEVTKNMQEEDGEMDGEIPNPNDLTFARVLENLPEPFLQDKYLDLNVGYFIKVHGLPAPFRSDTPEFIRKEIKTSAVRNTAEQVWEDFGTDIENVLSLFPETEMIPVLGNGAENILIANNVLSYIADQMGSDLYMQYTKPGEVRIHPSNRVDIVQLTMEQREFDKNFRNPRSLYMYDRKKDEVRIAAYRAVL